jgi:hypothetical protein
MATLAAFTATARRGGKSNPCAEKIIQKLTAPPATKTSPISSNHKFSNSAGHSRRNPEGEAEMTCSKNLIPTWIVTLADGQEFKTPIELSALETFEARQGVSIKPAYGERPYYEHRFSALEEWGDWPEWKV